jgi:long-chain acyl-CoA synthetase
MRYRYLIERTVRLYGGLPAVVCNDETKTFAQVYDRSCRLANVLMAQGCEAGDRVGVLLPNRAEYLEVDIGLALAGLVRVSLNTRAVPAQQREVLADAGVKALVYDERFADAVPAATTGIETLTILLAVGHGGDRDYEVALRSASHAPPAADPNGDDLYCLFYTSGTTGRPKGVMLTHRAYHAVAINLLLEYGPVAPGEKILLPQPMSHGAGFFLPAWFMSGGVSIAMEQYEPESLLDLAERHGVETIKVVPTMLLQLLASAVELRRELPHLRQVIYGASPMPVQPLEELLELFGPRFAQLYGQAEAPMCITVLTREDHESTDRRVLTSAGRPYRNVEVRVVDEDGRDVAPGQQGEVIVRGEHLMSGYWQLPELTGEVLRHGYVHTRDLAETDERGYVYLLGRRDDMIISGGFNIAPRAIEDVLARHPAILESAVIGLPHETLGQEVAAFVSLRPGRSTTEDEIIEYTRAELGFQKPGRVTIVDRLPRNAYGKVEKRNLAQLAGASNG